MRGKHLLERSMGFAALDARQYLTQPLGDPALAAVEKGEAFFKSLDRQRLLMETAGLLAGRGAELPDQSREQRDVTRFVPADFLQQPGCRSIGRLSAEASQHLGAGTLAFQKHVQRNDQVRSEAHKSELPYI